MSIPNDYREIVKALSVKPEEGNAGWRKDKYTISVTVNNTKLALWADNDEKSDLPFVAFGLYGPNGMVMDTWYLDESDSDYAHVFQLYQSAHRHAQGVPARLKQFAGLISDLKFIGSPSQ
ncbi:hypothetical protein [Massilia aquatica]|uniref:DUF3630 family protein n=1 Tax=Massilia aquatica TaxID=2609000 RepID=A0ABX0MC43_9BURK|nr:hypothetical protein [Massilia aquatica]NHZ42030.1 hypothetical protein [Massilia aquatica]